MSSQHARTTITMEYRVFAAQEAKVAALEKEVAALRAKGTTETVPADPVKDQAARVQLQFAIDQAVPLIQFAVANLPAHTTVGWPHQKLKNFGMLLMQSGRDQILRETGQAFIQVAREQADVETYRSERTAEAKQILGIPDDESMQ